MWVVLAVVAAAAVIAFTVAAAESADLSGPQKGGVVNGKMAGDWVLVPKGLLKGELLRKLHWRMWSNHVNGIGPMMAFDRWRRLTTGAVKIASLNKTPIRYTYVPNEPPVPQSMKDLLPGGPQGHVFFNRGDTKVPSIAQGGASWGADAGKVLPATDPRTWPWGVDAAPLNVTVFPPAAGFTSPEHQEAWLRHAECWLYRWSWGYQTSVNLRVAKDGAPKHVEMGGDPNKTYAPGEDAWTGNDPWYYIAPAHEVHKEKWTSKHLALDGKDPSNVAYIYWAMCCTMAQLRLLPFAQGMQPVSIEGASWTSWEAAINKMWSEGPPAVSTGPSGALKGLAQGATVFASMFGKGGATSWAMGAATAAVNLAKQLEGKGGAKWLWWHDDWTPVAIPRAAIASAAELVTHSELEEWPKQFAPGGAAAAPLMSIGLTDGKTYSGGKEVTFTAGRMTEVVKADFGEWKPSR